MGTNSEPFDWFGSTLAAGDFDGDGIDDIAVASIGEDWGSKTNTGHVTVCPGTPSGPLLYGCRFTVGWALSGASLGRAMHAADVDGDGDDELLMSVDEVSWDMLAGRVLLWNDPLDGNVPYPLDSGAVMPGGMLDELGASIATVDIDGDGTAEVLAGAPGRANDLWGQAESGGAAIFSID